jgi:hypothetical protein
VISIVPVAAAMAIIVTFVTAIRWSAVLVFALLAAGCAIPYAVGEGGGDPAGVREFGFIPQVDASARTISFDRADWLTGAEANRAAEADGVVAPGEGVPNDYYIRNPDKQAQVLAVEPDMAIRGAIPVTHLRAGNRPECESCTSFPVGLDDFFASWTGKGQGAIGKYWVTISGGRVVAIEEQYTP